MPTGSSDADHAGTARHDHYAHRILRAMTRQEDRVVLRWRDRAVTAGEFAASVVDATAALRRAGVTAGDMVAILTEPSHPLMLTSRYAAHLLGAAVVHVRSMNPRSDVESLPADVQAQVLRTTNASVLVVDGDNAERGRLLSGAVHGITVLDGRTGLSRRDDPVPAFAPYDPGALALVDFTSGSTNRPKMVRQPFATRDRHIGLLAASVGGPLPATLLSVTPLSHAGAPLVDATLAVGGTVVLHDDFDAGSVLRAIAGLRITDVYMGVPHLYRLLEHPGIAETDLSSLRQVTYSATPAAPARIAAAVAIFGDRLFQVYGTTEAGGITSLNPLDHREPELLGSVGRPFPWVRISVRDQESGAEVPRGEVGEVWVQSPTVMAGYLDAGIADTEVLRDGWLRTGDLGRWDRYGYLRLAGRVGNVIKSGGLKLDPATIERVLLGHPAVHNAVVYGVRDHDYVEHVHAAVEPHAGARCEIAALTAHVAAALSDIHVPSAITVWDPLPLLASGKPDLAAIRSRKVAP
jgi:fatty-acyl-CoA synthase